MRLAFFLLGVLLANKEKKGSYCHWTTLDVCADLDAEVQERPCIRHSDTEQGNAIVNYLAKRKKFKMDEKGRVCCNHKVLWRLMKALAQKWSFMKSSDAKEARESCKQHIGMVAASDRLDITKRKVLSWQYTNYCTLIKLKTADRERAFKALLLTKVSPLGNWQFMFPAICSQRLVDIDPIDDEVPLVGVCNFLRFSQPRKRYPACDDVPRDEQRLPSTPKSLEVLKQESQEAEKAVKMDVAMKEAIEKELRESLEAEIRKKLTENSEQLDEEDSLESDVNLLKMKILTAKEKFEKKKKQIQEHEPEIEVDEEENAKLEDQISKDRKQLEEDRKALEADKAQFATSREETSARSTEMKDLRTKLADLKQNIDSLVIEKSKLVVKLVALKKEELAKSTSINKDQAELARVRGELIKLREELKSAEASSVLKETESERLSPQEHRRLIQLALKFFVNEYRINAIDIRTRKFEVVNRYQLKQLGPKNIKHNWVKWPFTNPRCVYSLWEMHKCDERYLMP